MADDGRVGRIILLNGVSSSGKSSIAAELLEVLPTPFFHMAVDAFGGMRSVPRTADLSPSELERVLARTRSGFHRAVAAMAEVGNDVIMDHVLSEPWRLRNCLELFRPYFVFFVGVHCSVEELSRRERAGVIGFLDTRPSSLLLSIPIAPMTWSATPTSGRPASAPNKSSVPG